MQEHTSTWSDQTSYGAHPISYTMGIEGEGDGSLKLTSYPS